MKVYVVTIKEFEDDEIYIEAVFSTREQADKFADKNINRFVHEMVVDECLRKEEPT